MHNEKHDGEDADDEDDEDDTDTRMTQITRMNGIQGLTGIMGIMRMNAVSGTRDMIKMRMGTIRRTKTKKIIVTNGMSGVE